MEKVKSGLAELGLVGRDRIVLAQLEVLNPEPRHRVHHPAPHHLGRNHLLVVRETRAHPRAPVHLAALAPQKVGVPGPDPTPENHPTLDLVKNEITHSNVHSFNRVGPCPIRWKGSNRRGDDWP